MGFEMKSSQGSAGVADMHTEAAEEQYFILTTSHALGGGGKMDVFLQKQGIFP